MSLKRRFWLLLYQLHLYHPKLVSGKDNTRVLQTLIDSKRPTITIPNGVFQIGQSLTLGSGTSLMAQLYSQGFAGLLEEYDWEDYRDELIEQYTQSDGQLY